MKLREYFRSGEAWVWLNAGTVTISLIMVVGILGAALYNPVFTGAVLTPRDFAIALAGFLRGFGRED